LKILILKQDLDIGQIGIRALEIHGLCGHNTTGGNKKALKFWQSFSRLRRNLCVTYVLANGTITEVIRPDKSKILVAARIIVKVFRMIT
jgi:hypothetical protein